MKNDELKEVWDSPYPTRSNEEIERAWNEFRKFLPIKKERDIAKWGFVASLVMLLSLSYFLVDAYNPLIKINNFAQLDKEIWLPDGSLVLLKKGSEISFKKEFKKERLIELKGEAFFDVAKDSLKEFKVKTQFTITTALGTSFLVTERPHVRDTEIALYSGRVLVSVKDVTKSWALVEGEKFIFRKGEAYVKAFNANDSSDNPPYYDIDDIALEDVYDYLENKFGYRFISNVSDKDKRVTFRINNVDSLENVLNVLSIINNSAYELDEKLKIIRVSKK